MIINSIVLGAGILIVCFYFVLFIGAILLIAFFKLYEIVEPLTLRERKWCFFATIALLWITYLIGNHFQ
jgi:hypothetical protein